MSYSEYLQCIATEAAAIPADEVCDFDPVSQWELADFQDILDIGPV